jgi:hypothetical protein
VERPQLALKTSDSLRATAVQRFSASKVEQFRTSPQGIKDSSEPMSTSNTHAFTWVIGSSLAVNSPEQSAMVRSVVAASCYSKVRLVSFSCYAYCRFRFWLNDNAHSVKAPKAPLSTSPTHPHQHICPSYHVFKSDLFFLFSTHF